MIPAITMFSMINYLNKLNVKRIKKIRKCKFGFRELILNTDYGNISVYYNYKMHSIVASTARIESINSDTDVIKSINKEISNGIIEDISLPNFERILLLKVNKKQNYQLFIEIFGRGNTLLVTENNKIKYLENHIETKYRSLVAGGDYILPPTTKINPLRLFDADAQEKLLSELRSRSVKELYIIINLDKFTITEALYRCGIDYSQSTKTLTNNEITSFVRTLKDLIEEAKTNSVYTLLSEPNIILLPFRVKSLPSLRAEYFSDYLTAANAYIERIINSISQQPDTFNKKLRGQYKKLVKQKELLEHEIKILEEFIPTLYTKINYLSELFRKIRSGEMTNFKVDRKQRVLYFPVNEDLSIKLRYDLDPVKAISLVYDEELKSRKRGLKALEARISEIEDELQKTKKEVDYKQIQLKFKKLRKRDWYEAFRWFYTSNGLLAVGGRDAKSNRILIRKHLAPSDLVFHADYHGSPFVILKKGEDADEEDIYETAIFTASFSRAWKDGLSALDVYYVNPDQVSEKAPSGEYLKKGAFMIYGKKNFIRRVPLELCLSYDKELEKLIIGPCKSIVKKNTIKKIYLLYPGNKPKGEIAKKLSELLMKDMMEELEIKVDKSDLLNQLNSILPNGGMLFRPISKDHFRD